MSLTKVSYSMITGASVNVLDYGAKGDGVTNDTDAFIAASNAINAAGGGELIIPRGTYIIGKQTFAGAFGKGYSYKASKVISITACTSPVVIRGNGAILKWAAGLKFGSFDPVTGAVYNPASMPFLNTDYQAQIGSAVEAYNNTSVQIFDLEVDGNIAAQTIGGTWGDSGTQCDHTGFSMYKNKQVDTANLYAHHHGLDGFYVGWQGLTATDPIYPHTLTNTRSEYNGRTGMAWTGGNNLTMLGGSLSYTGKNGVIASLTKCGLDVESTSATLSGGTFVGVQMIDNAGGNAGPQTNRTDIRFYNCKFVGVTNYSWYGWGYCDNCTFEGIASVGGGIFTNCTFTQVPYTTVSLYGAYAVDSNGTETSYLTNCSFYAGTKRAVFCDNAPIQFLNATFNSSTAAGQSSFLTAKFLGYTTVKGVTENNAFKYVHDNSLATFYTTYYDGTNTKTWLGTGSIAITLDELGFMYGTALAVTDGITAPAATTGKAKIYVDVADGDLKVIFSDGVIKTIVTDT